MKEELIKQEEELMKKLESLKDNKSKRRCK